MLPLLLSIFVCTGVHALPTEQVVAALPDDPDLGCSGVKAVANLIQTKYARKYKKGLPDTETNPERRAKAARSIMGSACKGAFDQWAVIGKNADDESSTRRYSDFQAAMSGTP